MLQFWARSGARRLAGALLVLAAVVGVGGYGAAEAAETRVRIYNGSGSGTYQQGAAVPIMASTPPAGYRFLRWSVSGAVVADPSAASTQLNLTSGRPSVTAIATFTKVPAEAGTVVLRVYNGTGSGTYSTGTQVAIQAATPLSGYRFSRWQGYGVALADPSAAATTATVGMVMGRVVAVYTLDRVAVTVTGGTGSGNYVRGSVISISASAPPAGQVFDAWTGMVESLADRNAATTTMTVPSGGAVVAARYKAAPPALVEVVVVNGTGSGRYAVGSTVTIRAGAAPAGGIFGGWSGATSALGDPRAAQTELTVPSGGATVTATYRPAATSDKLTLLSHGDFGVVSTFGETIVGKIMKPAEVGSLAATVSTNGRRVMLDVDPVGGRFALRLFGGEAPAGAPLTLTFEIATVDGQTETAAYSLMGLVKPAVLEMVAGRLTFGATPALVNTLRTTDYTSWVNQQLDPDSIDDSAFEAMNAEALFAGTSADALYGRPAWQLAAATYSQRQLLEVMTLFWDNHFWSAGSMYTSDIDELRLFRQHALGKFRDLLRVSSNSPSMLVFLNNAESRAGAINENYARELLELHTVGVNGGYGDADVIAVARILTGWSWRVVSSPDPSTYTFNFYSSVHDTQDKVIPFLGKTIAGRSGADGVKEGEELLDILAAHPKTREFVCGKIVGLLVSDSKPRAVIETCIAAWLATDGNIREILRAILLDPAYLTTVDYPRSKFKTPFEYFAGLLRNYAIAPAAGKLKTLMGHGRDYAQLAGMVMLNYPVPTGFAEEAEAWINGESLLRKFGGASYILAVSKPAPGVTGIANYTQLVADADMPTAQAAAAYLLALGTADRFQADEYDAVVAALRGTTGRFDLTASDAEARLRKAIGLIVTLPSYQLQ